MPEHDCHISYRGFDFCKKFSHLSEVQSIFPPTVNVLALTATATRGIWKDIQKILEVVDPPVITASADKPNVIFALCSYVSFEVSFGPVVEKLRSVRVSLGRTIIYCANLYLFFKNFHGKWNPIEPQDALDLPKYLLVDMSMSGTHPMVKEEILQCFTSNSTTQNSNLYYCVRNWRESYRCEIHYSLWSNTQHCGLHPRCWSLWQRWPAWLCAAAVWERPYMTCRRWNGIVL